jgi:hypothetical protein
VDNVFFFEGMIPTRTHYVIERIITHKSIPSEMKPLDVLTLIDKGALDYITKHIEGANDTLLVHHSFLLFGTKHILLSFSSKIENSEFLFLLC